LLEYDPEIRLLGEMKPNEPMDLTFCPTTGHFLALAYRTVDPGRTGVLIESAHCILAGLDPSDEFAYALWHGKLWSVHLNDQDGQELFPALVEDSGRIDRQEWQSYVDARDYEGLEYFILRNLLGLV